MRALRISGTPTAVASLKRSQHGHSQSTVALVCNPGHNQPRKDSDFAAGKRWLRVLLPHQQIHATVVGSHERNRSAVVPWVFLLPYEPARSLAGARDTGSHTNRGG